MGGVAYSVSPSINATSATPSLTAGRRRQRATHHLCLACPRVVAAMAATPAAATHLGSPGGGRQRQLCVFYGVTGHLPLAPAGNLSHCLLTVWSADVLSTSYLILYSVPTKGGARQHMGGEWPFNESTARPARPPRDVVRLRCIKGARPP